MDDIIWHTAQEPAGAGRPGAAGRPRKGEMDERKIHLIRVAGTLFLERGYQRVSLAAIASEARVAVRTIYLGYGGKAGLFRAVISEMRRRFIDDQQALDPEHAIGNVLRGFGLAYLRFLADPQVRQMRRLMLAEAGSNSEMEHAAQGLGVDQTRATLAKYFADRRVRAKLRCDVAPDLLPAYFIACIAGEHLWPDGLAWDSAPRNPSQRLVDARLNLFLRSVLSDGADAMSSADQFYALAGQVRPV